MGQYRFRVHHLQEERGASESFQQPIHGFGGGIEEHSGGQAGRGGREFCHRIVQKCEIST